MSRDDAGSDGTHRLAIAGGCAVVDLDAQHGIRFRKVAGTGGSAPAFSTLPTFLDLSQLQLGLFDRP